jgi:general secretion pathway protein E
VNVDGMHITFASALRAVVRQDPDVILIGEIRDAETASIAVEAANTGHLVLATIHANNSALALTRMLDFGIDPLTLGAALRAVTAQRLVRGFSKEAKVSWTRPNEVEMGWLNHHGIPSRHAIFPKVESAKDLVGRVPVIEMIVMDERVRKTIMDGAEAIFNAAARQASFETLAQAGVRLVLQGWTPMSEVRAVVSDGDAVRLTVRRLGDVLIMHGKISHAELAMAITEQSRRRREEGRVSLLGRILVEQGVCVEQDIHEALGFAAEAPQLASWLVDQGRLDMDAWQDLVDAWRVRPGTSLWDVLENRGICRKEEIYAASSFSA